jgi:hypothetical protein
LIFFNFFAAYNSLFIFGRRFLTRNGGMGVVNIHSRVAKKCPPPTITSPASSINASVGGGDGHPPTNGSAAADEKQPINGRSGLPATNGHGSGRPSLNGHHSGGGVEATWATVGSPWRTFYGGGGNALAQATPSKKDNRKGGAGANGTNGANGTFDTGVKHDAGGSSLYGAGANVTNGSGHYGSTGAKGTSAANGANGTSSGGGVGGATGSHKHPAINGAKFYRGQTAGASQSGEAMPAAAATNGSGGLHYRNGDGRGINGLLNGHCGNEDEEDENTSLNEKGKKNKN